MTFGGNTLHVVVRPEGVTYSCTEDGATLHFLHDGEGVELRPAPSCVEAAAGDRGGDPPRQPLHREPGP